MLRYDISRLARGKRAKGTFVRLGAIHARPGAERSYLAVLRRMLRDLMQSVRADIIPQYRPGQQMIGDVDDGVFDTFARFASSLARVASRLVMRVLDLEKVRHTADFMATAKKTLGIDLSAVVRDNDLEGYMRTVTTRNTGLIRSLADQVVSQVEQVVIKNTLAGNSVKTLRQELQDRFDVAESRAQLIARDQVAKFNSDLNRVRSEQAGIEKYEWLTSKDERVRPRHVACNGKIYAWGEPTGAEDGLPPGQPIRCRCIAISIVEF